METPFDAQLAELSTALNDTYIPFGAGGGAGWANQREQDRNAEQLNSAAAASRAVTKSQTLYHCAWDLVDACRSGQVDLANVKPEDLPEAMRELTLPERTEYMNGLAEKRASIQAQIAGLSQKRDAFIADEMKRQALDDSRSFDEALRRAVRDQARGKGFQFKDEAPQADSVTEQEGC